MSYQFAKFAFLFAVVTSAAQAEIIDIAKHSHGKQPVIIRGVPAEGCDGPKIIRVGSNKVFQSPCEKSARVDTYHRPQNNTYVFVIAGRHKDIYINVN